MSGQSERHQLACHLRLLLLLLLSVLILLLTKVMQAGVALG